MAKIIPFRGVRFDTTDPIFLRRVMAPPYDVIDSKQKKSLLSSNLHNVIRLIIGNPSHEDHFSGDYQKAKNTFAAWIKDSTLKREDKPAIYIYRQSFEIHEKTYHRTGFIALSQLIPFGNKRGGILAHEHTLNGPKADRLRLMKACNTNFSSIFSLYPDTRGVSGLLRKASSARATYSFEYPLGIKNQIWIITDPIWMVQLQKKMESATLFIADGHHRYETALNYQAFLSHGSKGKIGTRPFDYVMMMFVAMEDPGLVILPTHRMMPSKIISSPALLLSRLSSLGELHVYPMKIKGLAPWKWLQKIGAKRPAIGLSFDGKKLYALQFSKEVIKSELLKDVSNAQKKLDVTLLHRLILEPFFGITKEKVEHVLSFTSQSEIAVQKLKKNEFGAVFFLNPTRIEQLKEIALNKERMPQKSTYFFPKLVTGVVFNRLDSF